jgi:apolipoprotein N-acyltransferase
VTSRLRAALPQAALLSLAALALALAFPRTDWYHAAWIALVPLLVAAARAEPRQALAWGCVFGFVFFAVLLRWLNFTFRLYSAIPGPIAWVPTALLAAYCGLFVGGVAWAVSWIGARLSRAAALTAAPFLWVAAEWLRGHLFGGFPWGTLGYTQSSQLTVLQLAELGGVHLVSLLLVAVNAALAGALLLAWRPALAGGAVTAAAVVATLLFGTARLREPAPPDEVRITLLQPSIAQPQKWDPAYIEQTLGIYFALMRQVSAEQPGLVVWPETALPTPLREDRAVLTTLRSMADGLGAPLVVGSLDEVVETRGLRNTAFLVSGQGIEERYDKIQLVPFGEFVPFAGVIGFVREWAQFVSELEAGSRLVVFPGPPAPFGVVICYEGIFPDLVRGLVTGGARLMVNMTNDAWFGRTSGPEQHLAMYPFRAVEHRIAVVRAANTGVSAFIGPSGRIERRMELFERGTLTDAVPLRSGWTLYARLGDWPGLGSLGLTAFALAGAWRNRKA